MPYRVHYIIDAALFDPLEPLYLSKALTPVVSDQATIVTLFYQEDWYHALDTETSSELHALACLGLKLEKHALPSGSNTVDLQSLLSKTFYQDATFNLYIAAYHGYADIKQNIALNLAWGAGRGLVASFRQAFVSLPNGFDKTIARTRAFMIAQRHVQQALRQRVIARGQIISQQQQVTEGVAGLKPPRYAIGGSESRQIVGVVDSGADAHSPQRRAGQTERSIDPTDQAQARQNLGVASMSLDQSHLGVRKPVSRNLYAELRLVEDIPASDGNGERHQQLHSAFAPRRGGLDAAQDKMTIAQIKSAAGESRATQQCGEERIGLGDRKDTSASLSDQLARHGLRNEAARLRRATRHLLKHEEQKSQTAAESKRGVMRTDQDIAGDLEMIASKQDVMRV